MEAEDIQLIKQLSEGSTEAFTKLYHLYFNLLYGFVLGITHSPQLTKEIVQEVFIKVWLNRAKINPSLSFKAWIFKIAQNLLVDNIRRRFSDPIFEDYLVHLHNEKLVVTMHDPLDYDIFIKLLTKAKEKLSPRQQEVFEMYKEKGLKASEVADRLQIKEASVYNYLFQAVSILRKEMMPFPILFVIFSL